MGYSQVNLTDEQGHKVAPNTVAKAVYDERNGKTTEQVVQEIQEELGIAPLGANGHEYVDLGLPSGTLWAKCNVGASTPEGYGKYFAWGEVIGYDDASGDKKFTRADYQWWDGVDSDDEIHATKYNATDGKTVLDLEDDAAHVNMGGSWRMPTGDDFEELLAYTIVTFETVNGVYGCKFSNKSDSSKYIFIPAAGLCYYGSRYYIGFSAYVWSSSLDTSYRTYARCLGFDASSIDMYGGSNRYRGQSVRGVLVGNKPLSQAKADKVNGASEGDIAALDATGNLVDSGKKISDLYEKKEAVLIEEDGIYQIKDNSVYPVAHPDLSTQPSILPQRFGNLDIKEVLIAKGRENEIPANAMVMSAWSFNKTGCCAAAVKKENKVITPKSEWFSPNFSVPLKGDIYHRYDDKLYYGNERTIGEDILKLQFVLDDGVHNVIYNDELGYILDGHPNVTFSLSVDNPPYYSIGWETHGEVEFNEVLDILYDGVSLFHDKTIEGWSITNEEGIDPDFTLVRYVGADNGYYYQSGSDKVPFDPTVDDTDDGEAVDLGLPSGTKWAKSNLGGSKPSDYGNYYQWGDTQGYPDASNKQFKWADYKYSNNGGSSESAMTKYNASDGKTVLDNSDDAAYAATSGTYKMPTDAQLQELYENTIHQWVELPNGVNGRKFVNKNDASKYIFIPAAGYCHYGSRYNFGYYACVWSSSLNAGNRADARFLLFDAGFVSMDGYGRCDGFSVRGVLVEN